MFYISFYSLTRHDLYIYKIINLLTKILEKGFFFSLSLLVINNSPSPMLSMMEEDDGSIYEDTGKKMLLFGRFNKETKGFMLNTDHQFFNG